MSAPSGIDRGLAVQASDVVVEYERTRDKTTLVALEDFSLDVAEGEFVAIVGPSGCGKSTFLNAVAGLIFPVAGEVLVRGKPVTGPGPDRAVVFQDYALMPWRTVEANVRFGLEMQRRVDAEHAREGRALHRDGRPDRLREGLPARALRRHAAARRSGPRPGHRAPAAADGRAVRRRGRDDPRDHAGRAGQDRRDHRAADHLHHPQRRRGDHARATGSRWSPTGPGGSRRSSRSTCPGRGAGPRGSCRSSRSCATTCGTCWRTSGRPGPRRLQAPSAVSGGRGLRCRSPPASASRASRRTARALRRA